MNKELTIFDVLPSEGQEGYMDIAQDAPEMKDDSYWNTVKDYTKTIVKGGVEGLSRFGRMMGPLKDISRYGDEGNPLEKQTEALNELLPTNEGFGQSAIRRGLQQAPTAMAFPGSSLQTLPRAMLAGFMGEGAKELGAPEWAQTAAELTAYIGPDITKKLLEKGSNKEIIASARKLGLSDEAITPLIQSDFKQKWLTKLAPKRGSTEKALEKTKSELSNIYSTLQKSTDKNIELHPEVSQNLYKEIDDLLFNMPAGVRSKISADLSDLQKFPATGESLINFYADINHELGPNSKQLSLLKKPIKEAIGKVSPELEKDFETINKLYSKYYPIAQRLKPNVMTDIIGAAKTISHAASLGMALMFGYYPPILNFAGIGAASKISQKLLLDPKFQQISHKMVDALNKNKFGVAKKLTDLLSHELKKVSPEVSEELKNITEEDFEDIFQSSHNKQ
jgi:hypothetical protein